MDAGRQIFRLAIVLLFLLPFLGGCTLAGNCAGWEVIRPSRADRLTDGTGKQILKHNLYGAKQGCWTARR